eukprot:30294-Pelagococcus_subviridis.AAC.70
MTARQSPGRARRRRRCGATCCAIIPSHTADLTSRVGNAPSHATAARAHLNAAPSRRRAYISAIGADAVTTGAHDGMEHLFIATSCSLLFATARSFAIGSHDDGSRYTRSSLTTATIRFDCSTEVASQHSLTACSIMGTNNFSMIVGTRFASSSSSIELPPMP